MRLPRLQLRFSGLGPPVKPEEGSRPDAIFAQGRWEIRGKNEKKDGGLIITRLQDFLKRQNA